MVDLEKVLKQAEKETFGYYLKKLIKEKTEKVFKIDIKLEDFELSLPKNFSFGDYASNVGFKLASLLKKNPFEITKILAEKIKDEKISKIEPVGGYLNFFLKERVLFDKAKKAASLENFFQKRKGLLLLEFGQPNTHKDPHIGHLFSYILGESLVRIFENIGFEVKRANYQGDIGLHVAKCLFGVLQRREEFEKLEEDPSQDFEAFKKKAAFLQSCYVLGSKAYEEDSKAKEEISRINKAIYKRSDPEIVELWEVTRGWSVEFYKKFEKILGVFYDRYYFESEVWQEGKRIVEKNLEKVFEKSQGAIVFKGERQGLHTRVFITKEGNPTYEGKEIGLISFKLKEFSPDFLVVTTAKEQAEYFRVVAEAADKIFPSFKARFKHVPFGMVNLKKGKMSSREGNIISGVSLYERVKKEIKRAYDVDDNTASRVALAAIKYSFLNLEAEKDMVFDIEESIAKEGNSGPYLLYTFVRIRALLEKTKEDIKELEISQVWEEMEEEERELLRQIFHFDEIVLKAAQSFSPHYIANFLFETAQLYNKIYQNYPVLKANNNLRKIRLFLSDSYKKILEKSLYLLGIETVEKL